MYQFVTSSKVKWEFANEGFLAGQRHLLKTIKRRRNVSHSNQQKGGSGACVEVGKFGLEGELERLKRVSALSSGSSRMKATCLSLFFPSLLNFP